MGGASAVEAALSVIALERRVLPPNVGLEETDESLLLDVVRDPRWGRVEECISEDPYLVGTLGTSYVRGLQAAGVHATLKHFVGYSASQAGRNFAPVHAGPRELADVLLVPFEMAVLDAWIPTSGSRSQAASTASRFISGSPMPMKTAFVTGPERRKWSAWSRISEAVRFRPKRIWPVAQNVHVSGQPDWLERQRERRPSR